MNPLSIIQYGAGPADAYILLAFWFAALVFSLIAASVQRASYEDSGKWDTYGWAILGSQVSTSFTIFFLLRVLKSY